MRFLSLLFLFSQLVLLARCLRNVTVDDTDPQIQYSGDWGRSVETDLNYNKSHAFTTNATSEAVFQFTGVAVYFLSPLWPYSVSTALSLDSRPTVTVNLTDLASAPTDGGALETVGYSVVWSAENLPNATHTLRVSIGQGLGQQNAIVDGLIYTALEAGDSWPLTASSDSDGHQIVIIVLAVLLGVLALILLGILLWLCLRKGDSKSRRDSVRSSVKWGGDAERNVGNDNDNDSVAERHQNQPPLSPQSLPPPSRPDSHYHPGEPAWSTSSVGGPGVPNMTGVGISARNSHATSYRHGDPANSASHYGASQGDLADSYVPGPYTNPNRGSMFPA